MSADDSLVRLSLSGGLEKLPALLVDIDLVSFDFFDTLFVRPLAHPEDAFDIIGERYGIENFRAIRKACQMEAFRRMHQRGAHEITIENIYECFPDTHVATSELMKAEIELEFSLLKPNEEVFEVFNALGAAGYALCIVSDMYLHESFFARALMPMGLGGVPLFISADCDATKRDSGELFQVVAKRTGTPLDRILHIGDNFLADVQRPRERGLQALHYDVTHESLVTTYPSLGTSLANGLLRHRRPAFNAESFEAIGYLFGGPSNVGFLHWIGERSREDRIDVLLFLSRDGYVLEKLSSDFDDVVLPRCTYFFGSRTAFTLASMKDENFAEFIPFLLSGADGLMPCELLERIGVTPPSESAMAELGLGADVRVSHLNHGLMVDFLMAYRWEILKVCSRNRRAYFQYLIRLGIRPGMRVALVDVGWSGTTQEAFQLMVASMFHLDVFGYYLCLADTPERLRRERTQCMRAMINSRVYSPELVAEIYSNRVVVELFFSAPHYSVIGLNSVGDETDPVFDEGRGASANLTDINESLVAGMLAFAKDYRDFVSKTKHKVGNRALVGPVVELASLVHKRAFSVFLDVKGFDAWGSSRNHQFSALQ